MQRMKKRNSVCNYVLYMLRLVYERFYLRYMFCYISGLSEPKKNEEDFLFTQMQVRVEQDNKRILVGQKDTILQKAKQRYERVEEYNVERRKKNRQRRIYSYMEANTPKLRLSWLCQGASFGGREANKKILIKRGTSTPYRWQQTKQYIEELRGIC